MKTIFLSHKPHEAHLAFAQAVGAEVRTLNIDPVVKLTKIVPLLSYFYPLISLFYSFSVNPQGADVLLVDGGSSLYAAIFVKIRNPRLKVILLDGDLFFYKLRETKSRFIFELASFFYDRIDAVLSVSETNKRLAEQYVKVPIEMTPPYPKDLKKEHVERENYGLYVGRLDPDKSIKRIIRFGLQCPHFEKMLVVGDGTYGKYVRDLAKLYKKKLDYLGTQNDVERFYSECKFLIHLPDYDPHPTTTMEAALCGCFPVMSRSIGTAHFFDSRFVVDNPKNFREVNGKIKTILADEEEARELLMQAIERFPRKEWAIKNFKEKFFKAVDEIKR